MSAIWWVRHGPTHEKAFVGWRDVPADLSDTASLQRLDQYLPSNAILISSDLIRSIATADRFAATRTRLPHDRQLREFNFGDWDGKKFDEVSQSHPELSRAYWERPGDIAPPNGESWNDAAYRVSQAVDLLTAKYTNQDIVIVAHVGVILTQIGIAKAIPPEKAIGHKIDNLSVTKISIGTNPIVSPINHLP